MNHKYLFLVGVTSTTLLLCLTSAFATAAWLWLSQSGLIAAPASGTIIALVNLGVDIVVGFFTVWGLYWAASQFSEQSVKPKLELLLGLVTERRGEVECIPVQGSPIRLIGYRGNGGEGPESGLAVALFLANRKPKMAQHIQAVIEVDSDPPVTGLGMKHTSHVSESSVVGGNRIVLQFEDELVVYMGQGVHIGNLHLRWREDTPPPECQLAYCLYKSEGGPDIGECKLAIQWIPQMVE